MEPTPGPKLTRRQFAARSGLTVASLAGLSSVLAACGEDATSGTASGGDDAGPVIWASFGGAYNEALQKHFLDPFTRRSGVKVTLTSNTSLAALKQQLASNSIQWDIAELTGSEYEQAVAQDLPLERLDFSVIRKANIPAYAVKPYGIQYAFFLNVMAWDERQVKQPPASWAEFFDPQRIPLRHGLYETLSDSLLLEFALLAQGVPKERLYPLDYDRAIKGIERLPKDKLLWYSSHQQLIQQMLDKEVALGMPPTGRVAIAARQGEPLAFTPDGGGVTSDYLVVPKGAKHAAGAMKLIDFICNDGPSAAGFMKETYYGVANEKAVQLLPKRIAAAIPTNPALKDKIFFRDDRWWSQNLDDVSQRFQAWQADYGS